MGKNKVYARALLALAALGGCSDESDDPGYGAQQLGEPVSETSGAASEPDDGTSTDTDSALPAGSDVPAIEYCRSVTLWSLPLVTAELEVLALINQRRRAGATCGGKVYPPAGPLAMAPALRCAARVHSKDMSDRKYFSHIAPDGSRVVQRVERAGYRWRAVGENIASGFASPSAVMAGWMASPGHCQNIMNPTFTQVGTALYGASIWTQAFGRPL